jgi:HK97 family phage portal protein
MIRNGTSSEVLFLYPFFRRCHMGIKSLFGFGQARDKPVDKAADAGYSFLFGRTTSGKPVNERTAMQTTAVYACVRILAEAVASLPLHVYEYQDDGGKKLVHDHPLYYLLHDEPNPEMTSFVFRETLMSHLLIWGNAYAQIIRDGAGRVLGLYPLLPDKMEVQRDDRGNIYYVYSRNSDENPMFKEYGNIKLKAEDVLHIPGLGFDGLIGYSPIAMAKNAVGMTLACEEYGASFFANGANPGGVLEHPGVLKDPSKVRESWNSVYRGVNNAHKIAVLEEGMKYQQIGIPPEEAQFLETRKFQINEIARLYRIPPHMVGDLDKSSFSNIEQQSLEFVKYTLDPWVIRWEQSLQRSLLLPGEKGKYFIKLNVDGLLRGDYQSRMNGYAVGRQNGWFSANDIREMENMNPIPDEEGGNLYLVNGAMTKLADAGAFAGADNGGQKKEEKLPAQENSRKRGKR